MRRCAFLTMDARPELTSDDRLAAAALDGLGWSIDAVSWRRTDVAWRDYDVVVVRSTWDYHRARTEYLSTLAAIQRETALENPAELIAWNSDKRYLLDLEARGVPIVPTRVLEAGGGDEAATSGEPTRLHGELARLCDELGGSEFVLKPVVGASADGVLRVRGSEIHELPARGEGRVGRRDYLLQPFVPAVADEGEYSVMFLGGDYSHTVFKQPASGDFRVQEDLGGRLGAVEPEPGLVERGRDVLRALEAGRAPLYARVDLVRLDGGFRLMEVELIEPVLFLGKDPGAPARFAAALAARYG